MIDSNQLGFMTYLDFSGHRRQVVLQPAVLADGHVFVSLEDIQIFVSRVKLPPQADDLPLPAVQRPPLLTARIAW